VRRAFDVADQVDKGAGRQRGLDPEHLGERLRRLRVGRCFPGQVYEVTAPTWLYQIAYEWAAMSKALVIKRGC
jgi:hypothetical protein